MKVLSLANWHRKIIVIKMHKREGAYKSNNVLIIQFIFCVSHQLLGQESIKGSPLQDHIFPFLAG